MRDIATLGMLIVLGLANVYSYQMGGRAERASRFALPQIKTLSEGGWRTTRGEYVPCPKFSTEGNTEWNKALRESFADGVPVAPRLAVEEEGKTVYLVAHDYQWRVSVGSDGKLRLQRYIHGYSLPPYAEDIAAGIAPEQTRDEWGREIKK